MIIILLLFAVLFFLKTVELVFIKDEGEMFQRGFAREVDGFVSSIAFENHSQAILIGTVHSGCHMMTPQHQLLQQQQQPSAFDAYSLSSAVAFQKLSVDDEITASCLNRRTGLVVFGTTSGDIKTLAPSSSVATIEVSNRSAADATAPIVSLQSTSTSSVIGCSTSRAFALDLTSDREAMSFDVGGVNECVGAVTACGADNVVVVAKCGGACLLFDVRAPHAPFVVHQVSDQLSCIASDGSGMYAVGSVSGRVYLGRAAEVHVPEQAFSTGLRRRVILTLAMGNGKVLAGDRSGNLNVIHYTAAASGDAKATQAFTPSDLLFTSDVDLANEIAAQSWTIGALQMLSDGSAMVSLSSLELDCSYVMLLRV